MASRVGWAVNPSTQVSGLFRRDWIGATNSIRRPVIEQLATVSSVRVRHCGSSTTSRTTTARAKMMCDGFSASTVSRLRLTDDSGDVAGKVLQQIAVPPCTVSSKTINSIQHSG